MFVFWTVGAHDFAKKFEMSFCLFLGKTDAETIFGEVSDRKQAFLDDKKIRFYNSRQIGCRIRHRHSKPFVQSVCELVYNKALSLFITAK